MTTRDIKIKVTGVQSVAGADDEPEILELETRGTYSEKNGNRYIKYDEFIEDVEEPVKNLLRFDEHALQLTKRGSVNTVMLFDREKNSSVHYVTTVEKGSLIDIRYCIDFNNDYITDCSLNVTADYEGV